MQDTDFFFLSVMKSQIEKEAKGKILQIEFFLAEKLLENFCDYPLCSAVLMAFFHSFSFFLL